VVFILSFRDKFFRDKIVTEKLYRAFGDLVHIIVIISCQG
jgi:hypothetical protein